MNKPQKYERTDPWRHVPFEEDIMGPKMQAWEWIAWSICFGFFIGMLVAFW